MKISVVINTYNASEHLEKVLKTAKPFDEIVVCDMESTDDTCEIAERYGCKVVHFPKGNRTICEPARNFAIQSASNPWVLVVDADELIPPSLHDYLREFVKDPKGYAGLYVPRKNYMLHKFMASSYPDYQLRFFLKEGSDWPHTIHSVPNIAGPVMKIPARRRELALIHISSSVHKSLRRLNLYSDNEVVRRRGKKISLLNMTLEPFYRFFKTYILKGSFRFGIAGLIQAQKNAVYKFMVLSKIYEEECNKKFWKDAGFPEIDSNDKEE
ncbi:MAG: glycosyltransferase family 2 protein [Prevotella sp.]|nr:glycosyltransferase family 2 protein [Bacteroides sp.]MCM1366043.1 glycosyltransferase family 2 protein [Prevotella sp.]MCM1436887.1 glycosyltransferase family 2 protein [Prevotella sp.]